MPIDLASIGFLVLLKVILINIIEAKYNGISFSTIKDLINQYIPTISNSLNIYMNDNKQKTILIKEFRKSLQYLSNIIAGKEKKDNSNIAFNLIS